MIVKRSYALGVLGLLAFGALSTLPACRDKKGGSSSSSSDDDADTAKDMETGNVILSSDIFIGAMRTSLDALNASEAVKAGLAGANAADVQKSLDAISSFSEKLSATQLVGIIESFLKDSSVKANNVHDKLKGIAGILEALSANENSAEFIGAVVNAQDGSAAIEAAVKAYADARSPEAAAAVLQAIWDQVKSAPEEIRAKFPINALLAFLASSEGTSGPDSAGNMSNVLNTVAGSSSGDDPLAEEQKSGVETIGQLVDALTAIKAALASKSMDEGLSIEILTAMASAANQAGDGYAQQALAMVQRLAVSMIASGADVATISSTMASAGEVLALRAKIAELARGAQTDETKGQIEQYLAQLNQLVSRMDSVVEVNDVKSVFTSLADAIASTSGSSTVTTLAGPTEELKTKIDDSFGAAGAAPSIGGEQFTIDTTFGTNGFLNLVAPKDVTPSGATMKAAYPGLNIGGRRMIRSADGQTYVFWTVRYHPVEVTGSNYASHGYVVLQRYDSNWAIDRSFGEDGQVVLQSPDASLATGSNSGVNFNLTLAETMSDGRLRAYFTSNVWGNSVSNIGKYMMDTINTNGTLDGAISEVSQLRQTVSFAYEGATISNWNQRSLERSRFGGYYVTFTGNVNPSGGNVNYPIDVIRILRVKDDLSIDTSFGTAGMVHVGGYMWGGQQFARRPNRSHYLGFDSKEWIFFRNQQHACQ